MGTYVRRAEEMFRNCVFRNGNLKLLLVEIWRVDAIIERTEISNRYICLHRYFYRSLFCLHRKRKLLKISPVEVHVFCYCTHRIIAFGNVLKQIFQENTNSK